MKSKLKLATIDCETDPFNYTNEIAPFVFGFYSEGKFRYFWGQDCVNQLFDFLDRLKDRYRIFCHNGGKFDFNFVLEKIPANTSLQIINGRLVKFSYRQHILQDSYAILPIKLADYQKDEFDYELCKKHNRELHKETILRYLKNDCKFLYEIVQKQADDFGASRITLAGLAYEELKKTLKLDGKSELVKKHQTKSLDTLMRPFYTGGRVECFKKGEFFGIHCYDINSAYPFACTFDHPAGKTYTIKKTLSTVKNIHLCFFTCDLKLKVKAIPKRGKDYGLSFISHAENVSICGYEMLFFLDNDLIESLAIHEILEFDSENSLNLSPYIDRFFKMKQEAEANEDKGARLIAKLFLNSAYGKLALNPENFCEYYIRKEPKEGEFIAKQLGNGLFLTEKPISEEKKFFISVQTAASITSHARANLLKYILQVEPDALLYTDTDSIFTLKELAVNDRQLGGLKNEGAFDRGLILGKKCYYLEGKDGVKAASKGINLTKADYEQLHRTGQLTKQKLAPSFSIVSNNKFAQSKTLQASGGASLLR